MAKILVFYYSSSGNTKKMAEAVAEGAKSVIGTEVELNYFVAGEALAGYDAIVVGAPTYHHDLTHGIKQVFEEASAKSVNLAEKVGAAFGSYGWSGEAPKLVLEIMKNKFSMKVIEPPLLAKNFPDQNTLSKSNELGKTIAEMIHQKKGES
jgi:flavodoxin I